MPNDWHMKTPKAKKEKMVFLDIFNREKRELAVSLFDYEQCHKNKRQLLYSFRKKALEELSFKYPDALFLMNRFHPEFMVLHKYSGLLRVGQFADAYTPHLRFVSVDDDLVARQDAILDYKQQVANCKGVIGPLSIKRFKDRTRYSNEKWANSFLEKGFVLTSQLDMEYEWLYGGSLFLDGVQIAKSSVREPKASGYFAEKIYEK